MKSRTFRSAEIDEDNRKAFEEAADFIRNIDDHRKEGTWIYIYGDSAKASAQSKSAYGTGKTYLMQCIANALAHRNIPSIYVTEETLFGEIKSTYQRNSDENEQDVLRRYYTIPILMIDDLFTANYTDWSEGKLFSILDSRYNEDKITIMTSNFATGRIETKLPENGGKIGSRIVGKSILIEMLGKDRRRRKR
ncbi:ATP-binding protein [Cohnella nanjingensis]|uniref:ATP-binding protein n=2 Tax=Cohnella nanjingensis TaxID=1387779 RepID=A0A7X0RSA1_9BACL|nr:ATP-binding protein [Cohnella nanjingensis]